MIFYLWYRFKNDPALFLALYFEFLGNFIDLFLHTIEKSDTIYFNVVQNNMN